MAIMGWFALKAWLSCVKLAVKNMPSESIFSQTRPVCPGAHLRVIAPAGPFNRETFDEGIEWLRQRYEVSFSEDIYSQTGYFAGTDERRLTELNRAITDDSVDAILCARGGFGCTRLLPGIDQSAVARANKAIIGFSDITALHALWARAGVRSIHAPMVAALGRASGVIREAWVASIENQNEFSSWRLETVGTNVANSDGRFFGGNLAVLSSLVGTPFVPPLEGCVLFMEDVGERPYRIDRMLTSLRQAGWFDKIVGLVLGTFTEGEPGPDGVSVDEVFASHFDLAPFPVLKGLSVGHIDENEPVSFGGTAKIDGKTMQLIH